MIIYVFVAIGYGPESSCLEQKINPNTAQIRRSKFLSGPIQFTERGLQRQLNQRWPENRKFTGGEVQRTGRRVLEQGARKKENRELKAD